jgi:hypothetical protein
MTCLTGGNKLEYLWSCDSQNLGNQPNRGILILTYNESKFSELCILPALHPCYSEDSPRFSQW